MAGGGGAVAAGADSYTQDIHSRLMFGYDQRAEHYDWQGSSSADLAAWNVAKPYSLAPGALRFVFERGITDKGGNPYEGVDTYDPDAAITVAETATNKMTTDVTALVPSTDWGNAIDTAEAKRITIQPVIEAEASGNISSLVNNAGNTSLGMSTQAAMNMSSLDLAISSVVQAAVDNAVKAFTDKNRNQHMRSINHFTGGMADINAVQSSAFVFGLAMLESDMNSNVADFRAKLELELYDRAKTNFAAFYNSTFSSYLEVYSRDKTVQTQFLMESTRDVLNLLNQKIDSTRVAALLQQDFAKMKIVAKSEEIEKNLEIDAKDSMWDMTMFQALGNLVSTANGSAIPIPQGPSRTQSAIGGMAVGAASGAALGAAKGATGGAVFGPHGALIGAGVGALAGIVAGLS